MQPGSVTTETTNKVASCRTPCPYHIITPRVSAPCTSYNLDTSEDTRGLVTVSRLAGSRPHIMSCHHLHHPSQITFRHWGTLETVYDMTDANKIHFPIIFISGPIWQLIGVSAAANAELCHPDMGRREFYAELLRCEEQGGDMRPIRGQARPPVTNERRGKFISDIIDGVNYQTGGDKLLENGRK